MTQKRTVRVTAVVLSALVLVLAATEAPAVGTRRFTLESGEDFKGGDLKGVAVDSIGRVRAGFNLGAVPVSQGVSIWSILPLADGSLLLGTGNEGKLLSYKGGAVSELAATGALAVTSMTEAWGGAAVLGTLPDSKLMKWAGGKLSELSTLKGAEHIWQVAFDKKSNAVFAATGPEGKLFRVEANGTAQVYFDAEEQHLMSVAVAPDGTVYAGASDKAKLYKITGPGRASVLYDFGRTEVRAIVVGKQGEVFAIANELSTGSYVPTRGGRGAPAEASPAPSVPKTKGKGTLYQFSPDGTPDQLLDDKDEHYTSLALGEDARPYVGTGVEGRVYTVDDAHNAVLVADTDERQVSALLLSGKAQFVASSDPAVLHPVRGIGGADAVWTSKVFDAGIRARFGRMSWVATGPLELSTRSGNTKEPDDTWSPWSPPIAAPAKLASPPGRFLQIRARWSKSKDAVLSELTVPFLTDNLRATVTSIDVSVGGASKSSGSSGGVSASGGPISKGNDSKLSLSWKVDNPDSDELRYSVEYRMLGSEHWFSALKPGERLTASTYSWDTKDLPEGRYRVRITASDDISNPPGTAKQHQLESGVVIIDNTPPTIEGLKANGRRVAGTVVDGVGPVQRVEIAVAGTDDWVPFFPKDGIFDDQREEFDADVSSLSPSGTALLSVRAYDGAGNFVVRNLLLK
ncbi:MAG: hypothetical protein OZ921_12555 [Sorangiineae bacterium]|nr:hypothetical protein [Polyangiaceae bacterium]MEB2323337.1 hypothetical protein [Sorangiineae bacterium]